MVMPRYARVNDMCVLWPAEDDRYDSFPRVIQFCDTINRGVFVLGEFTLTVPFILILPVHVYMYGSIIHALSNRPVTSETRTRNQIARLLIINGTVFFLCQSPYRAVSIHLITEHVTGEGLLDTVQYGNAILISRCLILLNSCANPFIYITTSSFYRRAFLKAIPCRKTSQRKMIPRAVQQLSRPSADTVSMSSITLSAMHP